ncbi:MAG: histidinol-phosphate aminotransferase family protein [Clostridia bacterium]|nr:histidinol-phosphate aminotransferase family protein [Clostridia bacterium]
MVIDMEHGGNVWEGGAPGRWLDFSANLRPEGTPQWVMRAMREALCDTRYYPDSAMTGARKGLADYAGVSPDCILPTAGGAAAIDLTLSLGMGSVFVQQPTFGEYAKRAAVHGRRTFFWNGRCQKGDAVVRCNPNNPTGEALSRSEILATHEMVVSSGADLIIDEAFIDFCPQHSVRRDVKPGLMVVGSLTKTLCMPGVRLGYVCAAPEVIGKLSQCALPWAVSTLAQAVAAKLPEHLDEIRQDAAVSSIRKEALKASLEALGAKVLPSQANFLLADFGRDMTQAAVRLKARGILVRTCASFGLAPGIWRLAVKTEEENARLIACLQEVLHAG